MLLIIRQYHYCKDQYKYICNPRVLYAPNNMAADKDQYKYICNPRVLYAPNNTAADTIIVKVSKYICNPLL